MTPVGQRVQLLTVFGLLFGLAGCGGLVTTDSVNPTTSAKGLAPTAGALGWRLPKTVLDADIAYTYESCTMNSGAPLVDAKLALSILPKTVADPNPFGDHSGDTLTVPFNALQSFWQDQQLTVVRYMPSRIIQKFNASAENQVGTIVGNVLTSAVRVAAIGLGVPAVAGGPSVRIGCNPTADQIVKEIKSIEDELKPIDADSRKAKNLAARRQALLDRITIKWKQQIDPGVTEIPDLDRKVCAEDGGKINDGCVGVLVPDAKALKDSIWYSGNMGNGDDLRIALHLDFEKASPRIIAKCQDGVQTCAHHPTRVTRDTMFREVAYIGVKAYRPDSEGNRVDPTSGLKLSPVTFKCPLQPCVLPFAQYGIPRALPISANLFEKFNWNIAFQENGEITEATFGNSASGVKATGMLASTSGSAASFATERRNSFGAAEQETLENQAEVARLKAIVDRVTLQQQVDALRAKGQIP